MKKILTFLSLMLCFFAAAQELTDTMYLYQNDEIIERIPISQIDSVIFVPAKAPVTPDTPVTSQEAVDLGLPSGLKWATCNVGASSPEEYGGYYAWGEIEEKDDYSWNTYRWCNGTYDSMTKYCTSASNGTVDNKTVLEPEDDVVHVKWGGSWRMPTKAEQDELRNNCTWTWKTLNGVNGYEVTGPNGNSIFLPAAGYRNGTEVSYRGNYGNYWSGSLYSNYSSYANYLGFNDSNYGWYNYNRFYGLSVRPVCDGATVPVESYSVSVLSNGNGVVSIEGTQESSVTVSTGASVTVVATPADGYKFIGWYIGESETPVSTDAVYTFTVSANVALVAKFELIETSSTTYEAVDLGLSVKWATCNVGASSPEEYGGYYAWGEIEEKSEYTELTYNVSTADMGYIEGNSIYDVARAKWGGDWHIPTKMDFQELVAYCTWNLTTLNGVNGYEVTGPNGNSIFLPATGSRDGTSLNNDGNVGQYWCSTPYNVTDAYGFDCVDDQFITGFNIRYRGRSVRPVCESDAGVAVWSEWTKYGTGTYAASLYWNGTYSDRPVYYRECLLNDVDAQFYIQGIENSMDLTIKYNRQTGVCQILPQQATTNSNYGPVFVADYQNYPGKLSYSYEEYPCMFKADKGLFLLNIVYYVDPARGSNYEIVAKFDNGKETFLLDGFNLPDYNFSMSFTNQYVNENGENIAVIKTQKGVDISKYLITVVEINASVDDVVNGMIDGTHSCYELTESTEVSFPIANSGSYKAVAVTFDETGYICEKSFINFDFYLNGNNPWKSLGYATYTDDLVLPLFGESVMTYYVEVLENQDQPGLFRMVDPYGPQFPLYPYASSYNPGSYIEIDATDPEGVWIEGWQSTGLDVSNNGLMEVTSMAWYQANAQGTTKDDAKAAGLCGVYADGVITFPVKGLAVAVGDGAYYGNENGAFALDMTNLLDSLPEEGGESAAPVRSARVRIDKPTIKATGCLIEKSPKLIK